MKSISFEEATNKIAEHQDEFNTVISQYQSGDKSVNLCFELTNEEIEEIQKTKKIWYKQVTGGRPMNPILISPFKGNIIKDQLNNLDTSTVEGKMLFSSLAILTTDIFPDKTPNQVLSILTEKSKEIFK